MFTLKFFAKHQPNPAIPCYRCIAVREFETYECEGGRIGVLMTYLDGTIVEWPVARGEYVMVENANGKTINKIHHLDSGAPCPPTPTHQPR